MTKKVPVAKALAAVIIATAIIIGAIFVFGKLVKPKPLYPEMEYNGFFFQKIEGLWYTQWQRDGKLYNIPLHYNPAEVEDVPVRGALNDTFAKSEVFYITFDPDEESEDFKYLALAASELSLNFVRGLNLQVEAACTKNKTKACLNRSIVTCEDADKAVIYLKAEEPTKAELRGNCLVLQGGEMALLKAVDRALYQFYKII